MSNDYLKKWRADNPEKVLAYQAKYDAAKRQAKKDEHKLACEAHAAAKAAGIRSWGEEYRAWIADYIVQNRSESP